MTFELEDVSCPHCGQRLIYRKDIRDHLTLKLCQAQPSFDYGPYNKVDRPYRDPDEPKIRPPSPDE